MEQITRSSAKSKNEDIGTQGSGDNDKNERTKLDKELAPPPT